MFIKRVFSITAFLCVVKPVTRSPQTIRATLPSAETTTPEASHQGEAYPLPAGASADWWSAVYGYVEEYSSGG